MQDGYLLNDRYQLLEKIGSGGMAMVYRARDLMLERYVAIKILREDLTEVATFEERFRAEARAAANLSHPNIVTIHDFGIDNGRLFIVMEYVPGKDLKTLIKKRGRFNVDESIALMVQACAGLGYAHRAGLVHCDVKPHNLIVTSDQRLKVMDFGIARALATIHPEERSDVVWGSPQYFSPEQAAGGPPSPASDVYALGVVMYEMLTGSPPFHAATPTDMARLHRDAEPHSIKEFRPDVPDTLEQIITKVLSKEPSARYRTADQLGRVLMNFGTLKATSIPIRTAEPTTEQESQPLPTIKYHPSAEKISSQVQGFGIDWISVGLGLLAVLAVGGLIPFWMWVYFVYNPPLR